MLFETARETHQEGLLSRPPSTVEVLVLLFRPDLQRLSAFLESLVDQRGVYVLITLVYDGTPGPGEADILNLLISQHKLRFRCYDNRLGTYKHAERAIRDCLSHQYPFIVADQDDWWLDNRLEQQSQYLTTLGVDAVTSNALIYCESDPTGQRLFDLHHTRQESLQFQLICNHVTGTATMFSSEVSRLALPFPQSTPVSYHDHWLGIVAAASRGVYVDHEVRWHYIQHDSNQVGIPFSVLARIRTALQKLCAIALSRAGKFDPYRVTVNQFHTTILQRLPNSIASKSLLVNRQINEQSVVSRETPTLMQRILLSRFEVLRFTAAFSISSWRRR